MALKDLEKGEMGLYLGERVEAYKQLPDHQRERLLKMAESLMARDFSEEFILAAVASTASVMEDLEPEPGDIMQSEQVREFIRRNAAPERRGVPRDPEKEVKRLEREQFLESLTDTIREARSAKAYHEIRKMRRVLLGIDQREARRVLGRDADEPLSQIRELLISWAPMFEANPK